MLAGPAALPTLPAYLEAVLPTVWLSWRFPAGRAGMESQAACSFLSACSAPHHPDPPSPSLPSGLGYLPPWMGWEGSLHGAGDGREWGRAASHPPHAMPEHCCPPSPAQPQPSSPCSPGGARLGGNCSLAVSLPLTPALALTSASSLAWDPGDFSTPLPELASGARAALGFSPAREWGVAGSGGPGWTPRPRLLPSQ